MEQPGRAIYLVLFLSGHMYPDGVFVKKYLPVLRDVPLQYIHKPWEMPKELQEQAKCVISLDDPVPCVDHAEIR